MIDKIEMNGVASYKQATCLETDKKVNLVYGLNGVGKSTLSNFLYDPKNEMYKNCKLHFPEGDSLDNYEILGLF
ncbi:AAA family ATPase [uncultured Fibrobacter sp.]|uniref:AAA family ATPase n=1 Tax=uncultured Fibrobacter sp. TaxID=261512 RepID=UPI0025D212D7|nr:AAA family ATPase [uncultured Fibrobacter sp.]